MRSKVSHASRTRHRLIRWAGANGGGSPNGRAGRMKQRLMELYFSEGADLTQRDVLVQAAVDCGMDAGEVREPRQRRR